MDLRWALLVLRMLQTISCFHHHVFECRREVARSLRTAVMGEVLARPTSVRNSSLLGHSAADLCVTAFAGALVGRLLAVHGDLIMLGGYLHEVIRCGDLALHDL